MFAMFCLDNLYGTCRTASVIKAPQLQDASVPNAFQISPKRCHQHAEMNASKNHLAAMCQISIFLTEQGRPLYIASVEVDSPAQSPAVLP